MTLRDRAAKALDTSLADATLMRGIRTDQYRWALAEYLDGVRKFKASSIRIMCSYLGV